MQDEIQLQPESFSLGLANEPRLMTEGGAATEESIQDELNVPASAVLTGFKQRAKDEQARFEEVTDSEYWLCLCFQTREQKEEFLAKLKLGELGDKYLDGMLVAEALGVTLESPVPGFRKTRHDRTYDDLALEL